jgi:hypothetical protein
MATPVLETPLPEAPKDPATDPETLCNQLLVNKAMSMIDQMIPFGFDLPDQFKFNLKSDLLKWLGQMNQLLRELEDEKNQCPCAISVQSKELGNDLKVRMLDYMAQFQIILLSYAVQEQEKQEVRNKRAKEFAVKYQNRNKKQRIQESSTEEDSESEQTDEEIEVIPNVKMKFQKDLKS